eukprot:11992-Heterococcus_DN1.PRE.2
MSSAMLQQRTRGNWLAWQCCVASLHQFLLCCVFAALRSAAGQAALRQSCSVVAQVACIGGMH